MCHTYIAEVGYICTDCQGEFKEFIENKHGDVELTKKQLRKELVVFMTLPKEEEQEGDADEMDVYSFFNSYSN